MTLDRNGKIMFVNRPIWGCSVVAIIGTQIFDYVSEAGRPLLKRCINDVFTTGQSHTCEITGLNGESESSFSLGPPQSGSDLSRKERAGVTVLTIRDVTEHKRAEEVLRTSGQQLREFAARLESVREEERKRVAREINDELGQALTILKLDLSWMLSKMPRSQREQRKKMKSVVAQVDETIERVRKIASDLRPSILDDLGLIAAIEWQLAECQKRTGIKGRLHSNIEKTNFDPDRSAAIFRVVQEALTNVVRHAKASTVRVNLKSEDEILKIFIADNGRGITEVEIKDLKSLGIVGMKERIVRVGGAFNIQSRRGHGTRIEISIPVQS